MSDSSISSVVISTDSGTNSDDEEKHEISSKREHVRGRSQARHRDKKRSRRHCIVAQLQASMKVRHVSHFHSLLTEYVFSYKEINFFYVCFLQTLFFFATSVSKTTFTSLVVNFNLQFCNHCFQVALHSAYSKGKNIIY